MWKRTGYIGLALLVVIAAFVLDSFRRAGEFSELSAKPLACRAVSGLVGPEDIAIDRKHGIAYISATDARAMLQGRPAAGALYRYDPKAGRLTRLFSSSRDDFHPHGISLWSDGNEPDLLYVVNHATPTKHSIEVFEVDGVSAEHVDTLTDELLVSPNDVLAINREELYVTNDHGGGRRLSQLLDDLLRRELAQVLHVKNRHMRVVVDRLAYANGINVGPDGTTVYVAETTGKRMRVYERSHRTANLRELRSIDLGTGADNIELAPDGSVYIAGHPKLITFLRHANDPKVLAPSEVVRVAPGSVRPERVYLDLGSALSASSVAAPIGDRLLIGAVFDDHFLDCKLPAR